jgi:hypothetical protein
MAAAEVTVGPHFTNHGFMTSNVDFGKTTISHFGGNKIRTMVECGN